MDKRCLGWRGRSEAWAGVAEVFVIRVENPSYVCVTLYANFGEFGQRVQILFGDRNLEIQKKKFAADAAKKSAPDGGPPQTSWPVMTMVTKSWPRHDHVMTLSHELKSRDLKPLIYIRDITTLQTQHTNAGRFLTPRRKTRRTLQSTVLFITEP